MENKPLTFEEFIDKYSPQYNVFAQKEIASMEDNGVTTVEDMRSFCGCMYETYGEELEYVMSQPNENIWTIRDDDGFCITAGFGVVNRLGFIITAKKWTDKWELVDLDND